MIARPPLRPLVLGAAIAALSLSLGGCISLLPKEKPAQLYLTVTGSETAYIAGVRWVAPAAVLFRQAVPSAFDEPTSRSRVLTQGEIGAAAGVLQLSVAKFEVDYLGGRPTISVMIRARLSTAGGQLLGERTFDVEKPAAANRVSDIVPTFDAATREALGQIVTWTDQSLDAVPPPSPPQVSPQISPQSPPQAVVSTSTTSSSTTTTTTHPH
jgi:cholesterol transport system auxiliary component